MISSNGKKEYFYPKKIYCTRSICKSLEEILKREDFRIFLLKVAAASDTDDVMVNICDSSVYKTFKDNGRALFIFRQDKSWGNDECRLV